MDIETDEETEVWSLGVVPRSGRRVWSRGGWWSRAGDRVPWSEEVGKGMGSSQKLRLIQQCSSWMDCGCCRDGEAKVEMKTSVSKEQAWVKNLLIFSDLGLTYGKTQRIISPNSSVGLLQLSTHSCERQQQSVPYWCWWRPLQVGTQHPCCCGALCQPKAQQLKTPTLWIAQICVNKIVLKGVLDFFSICVFKESYEDFMHNCSKKNIERMPFAALMISNISNVKSRCKSVFDDIYTKCHQCHTEK